MNLGSILPVGTIIHSMLTVAQFISEYGDNWVLADGRGVSNTKYATITGSSLIPDLRGMFLRGKNNSRSDSRQNPDGELSLGDFTDHKFGSHSHTVGSGTVNGSGTFIQRINDSNVSSSTNTSTAGGNETAPRSVTVNIFIRIN